MVVYLSGCYLSLVAIVRFSKIEIIPKHVPLHYFPF